MYETTPLDNIPENLHPEQQSNKIIRLYKPPSNPPTN